ncbi:MAG: hypothetical protein M3525_11995 [Acidobacteriota bacterium]|nr:hypothetical protein [Acidobacteriota bacterium]
MFYKRFTVIFLCAAFLLAQSFAQTKPAIDENKTAPLAPEVKEKSVTLLAALTREAEQFYLPENRVKARVLTASLLWEHDEKQARQAFQAAISELNTLVGQIAPDSDEGEKTEEHYLNLESVRQLRSELLVALAARDPKFALETLALTRRNENGENIFTDDAALELSLAEKIAEKDPKQAYELARKNLEKSLGYNLYTALESIYGKDAELGARLAREVLGKIKSRDIQIVSTGDYMSNSMSNGSTSGGSMTNGSMSGDSMTTGSMSRMANVSDAAIRQTPFVAHSWEIQQFVQSVKKLNRQAAKDKKTPVLSDAEMRDLIDVLAQKYVKQQYLSAYEVAPVINDIAKYFPAPAQVIRKKMAQNSELDNMVRTQEIQGETEGKTAEEIVQIGEKKPVAERDQFYRQAAEKALEQNDVLKARDFYARVKAKDGDYLNARLEAVLPLALAQTGDLREVRQMLAKLKTPEQRIEILSVLAQTVAENGDKKTALTLVGEARAQYSGRMKQRKNLTSVLQLAQAYAVVEPEQSFVLLEGNISFFNDLIAAGILLDDFNEYGSIKSDETLLDVVRAQSYRSAPNGVALIKKLAAADFDRTTALADRFARQETKFFARFRIVEALLDADAEKTEKEIQQSEERGEH